MTMNTSLPTLRLAILLVLLSVCGNSNFLFGQSDTISTTINLDAEQLIREVFLGGGQCFEVFNIELRGEVGQAGTFSNGQTSLGFDSGIVLSDGHIGPIAGPNEGFGLTDADLSTSHGVISSDPDLEILSAMENNNNPNFFDAVVLEFDFTPTLDSISFDFVFASEEYCDFSLSSFIDLFGFFISGPGINGPFTNNGINMAVVPGTTDPITANTVSPFTNSQYYQNNIPPGEIGCSLGQPAPYADFNSFDGFTIPLVASAEVIPCETYHLKMIVADRGFDDQLDAAVFLKANSFAAGLTSRITSQVNGPSQGNDSPYEGCGFTSIIFSRGDTVTTEDLTVYYDVMPTSTATPGVDYMALPDSIVIPAGQLTDTLILDFFADDVQEGTEFFTIKLRNPCDCSESELTITILEPPPLSASIVGPETICGGDAISLAGVPSGGIGEISYEWSNGDLDSLFNFAPMDTDTYQLIVTDECGASDTVAQTVRVQRPSGSIDGNIVLCDGRPAEDLAIVLEDGDTFSFDVIENSVPTTYTNITADTFFLPVFDTGVFQIGNLSADGCPGTVDGEAQVLSVEINTPARIDSIQCFGDADASISLNPIGGTGVYDYVWEHSPTSNVDSLGNLDIGIYDVFISDSNGCVDTIAVEITQPPLLEVSIDTLELNATCLDGGSLLGSSTGGTGMSSLSWSNGPTDAQIDNLAPGNYTLTATDENACTALATTAILADTLAPVIELQALDTLDCATNIIIIDASASDQGANFVYEWTAPDGSMLSPADPQSFDVMEAGAYVLSITNQDNGCSSVESLEVIQENTGLSVSIDGDTELSCVFPAGQLFFRDSLPEFEASWQLLDGTPIANGVNSIDITAAGTYELIVTQLASGCEGRDTISVSADTDAPVLSLINAPDTLTCSTNTVLLDIEVMNGSGNYTYNWEAPAGGIVGSNDTQDIMGTEPGSYVLIATDDVSGCQDSLTYEIIEDLSDLVINTIPDSSISCAIPQIELTASSPSTGNLSFEWFDSDNNSLSTGATATLSQAGIYTIMLTELDNNCTQTSTVNITADTLRPQVVALIPEELTCENDTVVLAIEESPDYYSLRWRNGMGEDLTSTTWIQEVDEGGGYILTVTDDRNGCRSSVIFEVMTDTIAPVGTISPSDTLTCITEQVQLSLDNITGSGNYTYVWEGPMGGIVGMNDQMQVDVQMEGSYTLLLTDTNNGCVDTINTIVLEDRVLPELMALNDTTLNCFLPNYTYTGSSASDGNLGYEWFDSADNSLVQNPSLAVNSEGTYRLVLTNALNGCTDELTVSVSTNFEEPDANAGADATIDCGEPTATLTGTAGDQNWVPSWTDANGQVLSTGSWTYSTSNPGQYFLIVVDTLNGCQATDVVAVATDQDFPVAQVATSHLIDCFDNTANIDASGSSQGAAFSYRIEDENGNIVLQANEPLFELNTPGTYTLVVVNNNNDCSSSAGFTVALEEPSISMLDIADIPCGGSTGSIDIAAVDGGTPPYLYSIDNGASFSTQPLFLGLSAGVYPIVIQDINGCEASTMASIIEAAGVELSLPEQVELNLLETYSINPIVANVAIGDLVEIKWAGSDNLSCTDCINPVFTAEQTTFLTLSVTDVNGCTAEATILFLVDQRVPVYIPNAFSPDGLDGANDYFSVFADPARVDQVLQMHIFDRWGGQVFSAVNLPINTPSAGWDGRAQGTELNPGVYVYWVEVLLQNGERQILEGDVLLLK